MTASPTDGLTPTVSFEFFPPADELSAAGLRAAIERLAPLAPEFISVTYGADGSSRDRTFDTVAWISRETLLPTAAHVTCIGAKREEIRLLASRYWELGIRHIVALRGDSPSKLGQASGGFSDATELVAGLKSVAPFEISVAGYPETHPESPSAELDLLYLKSKCDAGADRIITQFFFEPEVFLRFRDRCIRAGIRIPVVPGILPVTRFSQLQRFAARCGATVPAWLAAQFGGLDGDPETRKLISAAIAIDLVKRLEREGVDHFHFYTLNRADPTYAICHALGRRPRTQFLSEPPFAAQSARES